MYIFDAIVNVICTFKTVSNCLVLKYSFFNIEHVAINLPNSLIYVNNFPAGFFVFSIYTIISNKNEGTYFFLSNHYSFSFFF